MSVIRTTYQCDWPGCVQQVTVQNYPGSLRDVNWQFRWGDRLLCDQHNFRTKEEFTAAIDAMLQQESQEAE